MIVEDRGGVDVQDRDRDRLGRGELAVTDGEWDLEDTVLEVSRRPFEQPDVGVEESASGENVARIRERITIWVARLERDPDRVALAAVRSAGWTRTGAWFVGAIRKVVVWLTWCRPSLTSKVTFSYVPAAWKPGHPGQGVSRRVEDCAGREVIGPVDERIVFGVGGRDDELQRLAFLALDLSGDLVEDRRPVHARDADRELAGWHARRVRRRPGARPGPAPDWRR